MADVELAAASLGRTSIGQSVMSWVYNPSTFIVYASMALVPGVQQVRSAVQVRVYWQTVSRYSANYTPWYYINGVNATTGADATLVGPTYQNGATPNGGLFYDHTLNLTNYSAIYLMVAAMIPGGYNSYIGASPSARMLVTDAAPVANPEVRFLRIQQVASVSSGVAGVRALTYPGQILQLDPLLRSEPSDRTQLMVETPRADDIVLFDAWPMTTPRGVQQFQDAAPVQDLRTARLHSTHDGSPDPDA